MKNISEAVKKETVYVAAWVVVFSAVMQGVIIILSAFGILKWNYTMALGNLLGAFFSVLNFFLMALTVQNALEKEEKKAAQSVRISQMLRNLMAGAVVLVGIFIPVFNVWTVALPFFFPRIGITFRSKYLKNQQESK